MNCLKWTFDLTATDDDKNKIYSQVKTRDGRYQRTIKPQYVDETDMTENTRDKQLHETNQKGLH